MRSRAASLSCAHACANARCPSSGARPPARGELERRQPRERAGGEVEVARLAAIDHDGLDRPRADRGLDRLRRGLGDRIPPEPDDHIGHRGVRPPEHVVVVVYHHGVVNGAQTRKGSAIQGIRPLARPRDDARASSSVEHVPSPAMTITRRPRRRASNAPATRCRARRERRRSHRGEQAVGTPRTPGLSGARRPPSPAQARRRRHRGPPSLFSTAKRTSASAPAKSGLSGSSNRKFTCTGPAMRAHPRDATWTSQPPAAASSADARESPRSKPPKPPLRRAPRCTPRAPPAARTRGRLPSRSATASRETPARGRRTPSADRSSGERRGPEAAADGRPTRR